LATVFRHHSAAVADVSPEPWGDDAASDVRNFINDADMEAITWGPSDTDLAHRVDEYIDLPETKQALTILKSALRELLDTQ
jgi:succinyl-diaminopimelate desuccinylase